MESIIVQLFFGVFIFFIALSVFKKWLRKLTLFERRIKAKAKRFPAYNARKATTKAKGLFLNGSCYVIDGDSIVIEKTQVRLFGIDAPEIDHPYGQKAKWALVKLCKGQRVCAEILSEDHHGRTVAKCSLKDGRDLSAEMVKLGLAIDWPKFSGGVYSKLEPPGTRKRLWLADARQKGRMHVWEKFEKRQSS